MKGRESWESDVFNIIWALVNGETRFLGDVAEEFSVMEYQISSIEKVYRGKSIVARPDIVLHSNKLQHIWVIELTVNYFDKKKNQLIKYEKLDSTFFSTVVPFYEDKTVDVSVVVSPDIQSEYERGICEEEELKKLILMVYDDQDKLWVKVCGRFGCKQIDAFFGIPIKFDRIPQAIPYYPFHDMAHPLWKKYFATALLELLTRADSVDVEINPWHLVESVFPEGVYDKIASKKRKEIRDAAKDFLADIHRIIGRYMSKEGKKDIYHFNLPPKDKQKNLEIIRNHLNAWINSGRLF